MTNATTTVEKTMTETNLSAVAQVANNQPAAEKVALTAAEKATKAFEGIRTEIEKLSNEREAWEGTYVRTANVHLYVLLQKCYRLYICMEGPSVEAKALRQALKDYYATKGYQYRAGTHTMNKIVRCVFAGSDEKVSKHRVSTYGIALRAALDQKTTVENLPQYLTNAGGLEALRANATGRPANTVTAKQKAVLGSLSVKNEELGSFKHQTTVEKFDAGKADQNVVLLGTWKVDGSITVRAVVESAGVVNAALASFHSTKKAADAKKVAEIEQQALAAASADAIKDAANEAFVSKLVNG